MKFVKIALMLFGLLVVAAVVIGLATDPGKQPGGEATAPAVVAKPDRELVLDFYQELRAKSDRADSMYKPFALSLQQGDLLGATQLALRLDAPFRELWGEMSRMKAPELHNKAAETKLAKAKDAFANCYLCKSTILSDVIKYSENPNMKKVAEIGNTASDSQTLMIRGVANLAEAGEMVGVKIEEFK